MSSINTISPFFRVATISAFTALCACDSKPPVIPLLVEVQCPADRAEHAVGKFGKAEITFVCIDKKLASNPDLLRCDLESRPMICEDAGGIYLNRRVDGKVFFGPAVAVPENADEDVESEYYGSTLIVNFHAGPPRTQTFDAVATNWKFLLPDAEALLPKGFTFVKGTLCDIRSTVLNTGICNMEAQTASLYWHIAIQVPHHRERVISAEEYRDEIEFWMDYLGKLVVDPKLE